MTAVWNVLFVVQGKETTVKDKIEGAALREYRDCIHEVLVPMAPSDEEPHRKNAKLTPIYPGYVFLNLDRKREGLLNTILSVESVIKFLGSSPDSPSVLRDSEIRQIKSVMDGGRISTIHRYRVDDMVEIIGGHCRKLSARVSKIFESQDMLEVDVQLFGRTISTKVRAEDVRKA